jgi:hypothetical protein
MKSDLAGKVMGGKEKSWKIIVAGDERLEGVTPS